MISHISGNGVNVVTAHISSSSVPLCGDVAAFIGKVGDCLGGSSGVEGSCMRVGAIENRKSPQLPLG